MGDKPRTRVEPDGTIRLPKKVVAALGWMSGDYIGMEIDTTGGNVSLSKIDVDPFAEAMRTPDADAFDKILAEQQQSQADAFKTFDEKMKDPPEVRPEDREDHWR